MTLAEKEKKIRFIIDLALEEMSPKKAYVFLARLHNLLPKNMKDLTSVLNGVHKELHKKVN